MRRLFAALVMMGLPLVAPNFASAETLADIKAELAALSAEFTALRQELVASGATAGTSAGGSPLQRMDAIEAELVRLTAKTEELENRITTLADQGDLRLGDLEFRVTELEGGDPAAAPAPKPLAEEPAAPSSAQTPAEPATPQPELAVNEQADFDRAKAALDSGTFRSAADLFDTFAKSYPGGSLTAKAQVLRGDALAGLGETANAARAYLEAFSGDPSGAVAPDALYKLGLSLSQLGQVNEACITLGEVSARFPDAGVAADAEAQRQALQCL